MTRQLFLDTKWMKCQINCPHKISACAGNTETCFEKLSVKPQIADYGLNPRVQGPYCKKHCNQYLTLPLPLIVEPR